MVNTPLGKRSHYDEVAIRRAATMAGVLCITTLSGARAAVDGMAALREGRPAVRAIQELSDPPPSRALSGGGGVHRANGVESMEGTGNIMMRLGMWMAAALALAAAANEVNAERAMGVYGLGARTGLAIDPDQFVIGGHIDLGDIAPRLQFQPTVEASFGDDLTIVTTMAEANYHFRDPDDWDLLTLYVGAALGPVFISNDNASDTEVGLTVQSGVRKQIGDGDYSWLGEVRLGIADTPDWKFVVGFTLGN